MMALYSRHDAEDTCLIRWAWVFLAKFLKPLKQIINFLHKPLPSTYAKSQIISYLSARFINQPGSVVNDSKSFDFFFSRW